VDAVALGVVLGLGAGLAPGPLLAVRVASTLAGAVVVAHLALDALPARPASAARPVSDLRRGALVNVLSPHPWLFWITVGGPLLVDAADRSIALAAGFAGAFYVLLVGTKVALAGLVAAGRRASWARAFRPVSVALLGLAAIALLVDGIARL
jgi:threonine/homoserine/homoserine lactone efflux protein